MQYVVFAGNKFTRSWVSREIEINQPAQESLEIEELTDELLEQMGYMDSVWAVLHIRPDRNREKCTAEFLRFLNT